MLEAMILPSLDLGGYSYEKQVSIGERPNGSRHIVDVVAKKGQRAVLLSLKWQQVSGTAEQKVPYEVIRLMKAVAESYGKYARAYIVLGGSGWTLRDWYVGGGMKKYLAYEHYVSILTLEDFIAQANRGEL
jgi:hypothetical protein